jgi:hypothetical protein
MNIDFQDGIVKYNGFEGVFDSIEQVDDNFAHIIIGGIPLGLTISDTTINGVSYDTVSEFIAAFND